MRCNNHDDLLHLGFVLMDHRPSMMDFFANNNKLLTKKSFIINVRLGSKYVSAFIC